MPTGKPSATPIPHSAAPAIATGSEPPKTTRTRPAIALSPVARTTVTRPFEPASGYSVTIPVSGNVDDVLLQITSNTGAPAGQVAELQVFGVPAPNPDLTVTAATWSPAAPVETTAITVGAFIQVFGTTKGTTVEASEVVILGAAIMKTR